MKKVLVGHRGVGKTSLLKRMHVNVPSFDLDAEIERHSQKSITEIFAQEGESKFRELEIQVFKYIYQNYPAGFLMALGAGFDLESIPSDVEIIFVSRVTDRDGRLFQDRPRLTSSVDAITEYKLKFSERQPKFLAQAWQIYDLPEGEISLFESKIINEDFQLSDAIYTLCLQDIKSLSAVMRRYKQIELRTDLLPDVLIQKLIHDFPEFNWLYAVRSETRVAVSPQLKIDFDIQFYKGQSSALVSSHHSDIFEGIRSFEGLKNHLKLCPEVKSFSELILGYRWQQQDPQNRSFLPRSSDGRWMWYRQLAKYFQKINFVKCFTRMDDQPSLSEWLVLPEQRPRFFAAVFGMPVHFSRSPKFHERYMAASFFTKIAVESSEFSLALEFLMELGLQKVAVTSPHKKAAGEILNTAPLNTLFLGKDCFGTNTDTDGFSALIAEIPQGARVAVWGGGGTRDMMKSVLPEAVYFSGRTGLPDKEVRDLNFEYLIWAAPRWPETQFPESALKFKKVLDLNYSESSMGLEFAMSRNIGYTSGLKMFEAQALKQQQFWSECERK